jgi:coenzyme F420-reducing hydrogenase beta subunit
MSEGVIERVVQQGLCIGCGLCAGLCPSGTLAMETVTNGDLVATSIGPCLGGCSFCLAFCPFSGQVPDEGHLAEGRFTDNPGVQHHPVLGHYLATWAAYSTLDQHRQQGSSGGMVTWLLEELLKKGRVDAVIAVGREQEPGRPFGFQVLRRPQDVRAAAGSRYFPVSLEKILSEIESAGDQRYALVGLPCLLKGVEAARRRIPHLANRLTFLVGLTCGHLPNHCYTEYLARLSGLPAEGILQVDYRLKKEASTAADFGFQAQFGDRWGRLLPFRGKVAKAWTQRHFQFDACNYCEDVFAEVADVAAMDAWLPEYARDPRGHSLLVVRHPEVRDLLLRGEAEGRCRLIEEPPRRIVESQAGAVAFKREGIASRLQIAREKGRSVPPKRTAPGRFPGFRDWVEALLLIRLQQRSKQLWPNYRDRPLAGYHARLFLPSAILSFLYFERRLAVAVKNPRRMLRRLFSRRHRGG